MAVYALLVGINGYTAVTPLEGCVNDIEEFGSVLTARVTGTPLHVEQLLDAQATYAAITETFRRHLGQAGPGDIAVFAYAGHGSTQKAAPELLEPDGRSETLVCVDSRTGTVFDLADVELAKLISSVVENGAEVVCVFDCCHSGTITRDVDAEAEPEPGERRAPSVDVVRPLDTYIPELQDGLGGGPGSTRGADVRAAFDLASRHVVLSACQSDETAKEVTVDGRTRGALSAALGQALVIEGPAASVRQLARTARARVLQLTTKQNPVLYATVDDDLERPFLGAGSASTDRSFLLFSRQEAWEVDGGRLHGLTAPVGGAAMRLAVTEPGQDLPLGHVEVATVEPTRAVVTPLAGLDLDASKHYRASIASQPLPPLVVQLVGDAAATAPAGEAIGRSPLLGTQPRDGATTVVVRVAGDHFVIETPDGAAIQHGAGPLDAAGATMLVGLLEHLARWHAVLALENAGSALASQVALEWVAVRPGDTTLDANREATTMPEREGGITIDYSRRADGTLEPARWFLRIVNRSGKALHVRLLDLTDGYSIDPGLFTSDDRLIAGGWEGAYGRQAVPFGLPEGNQEPGATGRDWLKLVVSEEPLDVDLLRLPRLGEQADGSRDAGAPRADEHRRPLRRHARHRRRRRHPRPGRPRLGCADDPGDHPGAQGSPTTVTTLNDER